MAKTPRRKKVVAIGDLHCGSRVGLTPPKWQLTKPDKYTEIREECWQLYTEMIDAEKPIDVLLVNGDAIDGPGARQGGTDVLTTDPAEQIDIAEEAIRYAEAKHVVMTYGTFYHTGVDTDWESVLARHVKAEKISAEEHVDINGLIINMKHTIGRSSIPHGRATPIARDRLWNLLWNERGQCPKADVILRSHVHYFHYTGEHNWLAMTLPALCGLGSKYGSRIPSETVDFGIVWFDIQDKERWSWGWNTALGATQKTQALAL